LRNDGVLPTASIFTESSEGIFPAEWHFVTKLGPQVSPFPVPIFGVNTHYQMCNYIGINVTPIIPHRVIKRTISSRIFATTKPLDFGSFLEAHQWNKSWIITEAKYPLLA
jgi:hypothetical protein